MKTTKNTTPPLLNCLYAVVAKEKIAYLKFILEGYDGLSTLSTVDIKDGLISLKYFHGFKPELVSLLDSMQDAITRNKLDVKH
ncbi:MAG: DUF4911 domain-containing protein [Proteobacteria bacterium]|nr:DUF4911 domain-containing protein [Pseudomonadota bacterium]MBU1739049.1 DUF4911 domain-containing protein [Pseudomonadota bacterium]